MRLQSIELWTHLKRRKKTRRLKCFNILLVVFKKPRGYKIHIISSKFLFAPRNKMKRKVSESVMGRDLFCLTHCESTSKDDARKNENNDGCSPKNCDKFSHEILSPESCQDRHSCEVQSCNRWQYNKTMLAIFCLCLFACVCVCS